MDIKEMKADVLAEVTRLENDIATNRRKRAEINAEIKADLEELAEAKRFAKAFEKRTRTTKTKVKKNLDGF